MYKSDISLEFYITSLPMKLRTVFSRFRCRNHKLLVETGIYKNIPSSERVCVKCTQSEIGDEFHYIFNCQFFADQRRHYLPKYCHIHPSAPKFKSIMNDKTKLRNLANFIKIFTNHPFPNQDISSNQKNKVVLCWGGGGGGTSHFPR